MTSSPLSRALPLPRPSHRRWGGGIVSLLLVVLLGVGACATAKTSNETLYQQLGGQPGIEAIIQGLTKLYRTDPRIKEDFANINPNWLGRRLTDYICAATGGPCIYKGRDMVSAHKGLGLNSAKFNAVVEDLQTAMDQAHVPYEVQNRLLARLAPTQRSIVAGN